DGDPQGRQDVVELGVGAAVQVAGRDDVVAGLGQVDDRVEDGAGARRHAQTAQLVGPFHQGDALLQHVGGRVHQPGVDVAQLAEREQVGRVLGVLEDERAGPVDGYGPGAGGRVGLGAAVQAEGLK